MARDATAIPIPHYIAEGTDRNPDPADMVRGEIATNPFNRTAHVKGQDDDLYGLNEVIDVDKYEDIDGVAVPAGFEGVIRTKGATNEPSFEQKVVRGVTGDMISAWSKGDHYINAKAFGIVAPTDDAAQKLNACNAFLRLLVKATILFDDGAVHNWGSVLNLPDGISLETFGTVTINVTAAISRCVRTEAFAENCNINGHFIWDGKGLLTTSYLELHQSGGELNVDGSEFLATGSDPTEDQAECIRVGVNTKPVSYKNLKANGAGTMIFLRGNSAKLGTSNVTVSNLDMQTPANDANILYIGWYTRDLYASDLKMGAYNEASNGSHMIQSRGESSVEPLPTSERINLERISCQGRPSLGWTSGNPNGSHGDMIVIRGVLGGSLTHFWLYDGGEYGVDIVHSTEDFIVSHGHIYRMDGSGFILGTTLDRTGGDQVSGPVKRCHFTHVHVYDCGLDQSGSSGGAPLGFTAISAANIKNCDLSSVTNCTFVRAKGAGLHISNRFNTTTQLIEFPVTRFTHHSNTYLENGTEKIGADPVWSGQTGSMVYDAIAGTLAFNTAGNRQTWTGVGNGISAFPEGNGGLHAANDNLYNAFGVHWNPEFSLVIPRDGTRQLDILYESSNTTLHAGYIYKSVLPVESELQIKLLQSDGNSGVLAGQINVNSYEPVAGGGTTPSTIGMAQVRRLYYDIFTKEYFLQYGDTLYSEDVAQGLSAVQVAMASLKPAPAHPLPNTICLGKLAIRRTTGSTTTFATPDDAIWETNS